MKFLISEKKILTWTLICMISVLSLQDYSIDLLAGTRR